MIGKMHPYFTFFFLFCPTAAVLFDFVVVVVESFLNLFFIFLFGLPKILRSMEVASPPLPSFFVACVEHFTNWIFKFNGPNKLVLHSATILLFQPSTVFASLLQFHPSTNGIWRYIAGILVKHRALKRTIKNFDELQYKSRANFLKFKFIVHNLVISEPNIVIVGQCKVENMVNEGLTPWMIIWCFKRICKNFLDKLEMRLIIEPTIKREDRARALKAITRKMELPYCVDIAHQEFHGRSTINVGNPEINIAALSAFEVQTFCTIHELTHLVEIIQFAFLIEFCLSVRIWHQTL